MSLNFILATKEEYASKAIPLTGSEREFAITTPTGTQTLVARHVESQPDQLIDLIRAMPSVEFLKEEEFKLFAQVNGLSEEV